MINAKGTWGDFFEFEITTRQGVEKVIVDFDQAEKVEKISRWVLYKDPKGRKMARSDKTDGQVLLHRYLFDIPQGSRLEWANGNTLDCRRKNLRLVDRAGNITLIMPVETVVKSEIKGVFFHKASQLWNSRPYWESKRYSLGYFKTRELAEAETRIFFAEGPDSPKLKRNQRKGKN